MQSILLISHYVTSTFFFFSSLCYVSHLFPMHSFSFFALHLPITTLLFISLYILLFFIPLSTLYHYNFSKTLPFLLFFSPSFLLFHFTITFFLTFYIYIYNLFFPFPYKFGITSFIPLSSINPFMPTKKGDYFYSFF